MLNSEQVVRFDGGRNQLRRDGEQTLGVEKSGNDPSFVCSFHDTIGRHSWIWHNRYLVTTGRGTKGTLLQLDVAQ